MPCGGGRCPLDILTPVEITAIRRCRQEFLSQIITLAPDVFAWHDYLLPHRHFDPAVLYYRHQLSLLERPEELRGRAVMDVGAFIGDSALVLRHYTDGPIYCFEPQSDNYQLLQRTISLNACREVLAVNQALGSRSGQQAIVRAESSSALNPEQSPMHDQLAQQPREQVQVTTLDDFVRGLGLDIGLIKVDVEGFEQEFLAGARDTISTHRPVLLLSIYHNADDFLDIKPLIESWDLDYSFRISHPPLERSFINETLLICEPRRN